VSTFGADQFDEDDPRDRKEKSSFFNWLYWSINIGALVRACPLKPVCIVPLKTLLCEALAGLNRTCLARADLLTQTPGLLCLA